MVFWRLSGLFWKAFGNIFGSKSRLKSSVVFGSLPEHGAGSARALTAQALPGWRPFRARRDYIKTAGLLYEGSDTPWAVGPANYMQSRPLLYVKITSLEPYD